MTSGWLYGACGAAALLLGLLISRALAPLVVGAEITLPKELLDVGPALEAPRAARSPVAIAVKTPRELIKRERAGQRPNLTTRTV